MDHVNLPTLESTNLLLRSIRESDLGAVYTFLFNLDFNNGRSELGYTLGQANWGKGYAPI